MRRLVVSVLLLVVLAGCSTPFDTPNVPPVAPTSAALNTSPTTPALVPSAAAPAPAPTTASGGAVTVSFATWDYERPIYESLAKAFSAQNPNITIALVPLEDLTNSANQTGTEAPQTQLRRIVAGADTAPAVFTQPNVYGSKLLYNLKPLMDADATFKRDDFYAGTLERYTTADGVWVLPHYFSVQLLDYNKDLFTQHNLPEPKPGWTWADLFATAEQLAKSNNGAVSTYGYFDWSNGFVPLMAQLQTQNIDVLNKPAAQVQLDQPEIVAASKHVRDLAQRGVLLQPENRPDQPPVDVQQLVHDGRVGIWQNEVLQGASTDSASSTPGFAVGKVPYPADTIGLDYTSSNSDGYIMSGGTAHSQEAWKWIEFLSRHPTNQQSDGQDATPDQVPARQSLAAQTGFWDNMDEATKAVYQAALTTPMNMPDATRDPATTGVLFSTLQQAFYQIMNDKTSDPQTVLAQAQTNFQTQLTQAQQTPVPTPDLSQVVVATPEPQEAPAGATSITFSAMGYSASDLRRVARAFRQQHPDIFVQIASTDTFTGPVSLRDVAQINDCFAWTAPPQNQAEFDALLNLQPLMDADATFVRNDVPVAVLAPYQHDGGVYGLPYAFSVRAINYNRALFDKVGQQVPTSAWKPDDFLQAAKALTNGDGDTKQYGYVPLGDPQQDLLFFIGQFGGQLTTGSGKSARPTFDDPKVADALQWYLDLANVHKVMPPLKLAYQNGAQSGDDQSYSVIQSGRAAMWLDYSNGTFTNTAPASANSAGTVSAANPQTVNFEVGAAPLPVGVAGLRSSDLLARGFHIAAHSQHPQACWTWLTYLSQDTSSFNGDMPARTSIATSDTFAKQASASTLALYQAYGGALKQALTPGTNLDTFYQMDPYWFYKAISEASAGKADLRMGLEEAQKFTTAFMACMEQENKPATCAKRVDPNYQGYNTNDTP